ncbi:MAG: hypothetical protein JNG89_00810, partial [Planctomycetaceae bacterium]|nr:hypothetical protein [Planctomycetaceae bacterium]
AQPGNIEGFVPGTLSFDSIAWNHPRAADILVDANWTDALNTEGYRGFTTSTGVAGHGSTSPFDIHIRLIADGPDIADGIVSPVPTGNIDLAPTICSLLGIERPTSMRGRVLSELFPDGPVPESVTVQAETRTVSAENGYHLELKTSQVGQTIYIDSTRVTRHAGQ